MNKLLLNSNVSIDWNGFLNSILSWVLHDGLRIIIALIVLFVSYKIINFIARRLTKSCEKKKVDKTVSRTLIYILKLGLKIVVAICLVGYVGIDTSGLAALVTSLGVCIGLAVNGALSNLAGGIMIILTRPFRIDDYIEACGHGGTVKKFISLKRKFVPLTIKSFIFPTELFLQVKSSTIQKKTLDALT